MGLQQKRMRPAVYLIGVPGGFLKIGVSNDAPGRLRALQIAHHQPLELLFWSNCEEQECNREVRAEDLERRMHELLGTYRTRGEWFEVTLEEAMFALKMAWWERVRPFVVGQYWRLWLRHESGEDQPQ